MKHALLISSFLSLALNSNAQVSGGHSSFEFLRIAPHAQHSALGGINVSHPGKNIALGSQNPALYRPYLHNQLSLSYNSYFAGIGIAQLHYGYYSSKLKTTFATQFQNVSYGDFVATNEYGNEEGNFKAGSFMWGVSAAKTYNDKWSYGATVKYAQSKLLALSANALLFDVGVNYYDTANLLSFGAVATNMGFTMKSFNEADKGKDPLPFDLRLGVSKRFKYVPLRLMATYHHLQRWDVRYNNPADISQNNLLGVNDSVTVQKKYFSDKLFRHFIFGAEITLAKRLAISVAYNHMRRQEMMLASKPGMAGFSFGAGLDLNKIKIHYARNNYHLAGGYNEFAINLQMNQLLSIGKGKAKNSWKANYPIWGTQWDEQNMSN